MPLLQSRGYFLLSPLHAPYKAPSGKFSTCFAPSCHSGPPARLLGLIAATAASVFITPDVQAQNYCSLSVNLIDPEGRAVEADVSVQESDGRTVEKRATGGKETRQGTLDGSLHRTLAESASARGGRPVGPA